MSAIHITSTDPEIAHRHWATREIKQKQTFWRHLAVYGITTLAFWVSWGIAGSPYGWIAPWPLLPTIVGGLVVGTRQYRIGARPMSTTDESTIQ